MPTVPGSRKGRKKQSESTPNASAPHVRQRGFFPADDGTSLYYEVLGHGRPLVLCYGLTCQREHWRYQVEHFSKHYQVVLFDYRGHPCSDIPKNEKHLTVEWCGKDVLSLIRYLKLERPVCMGHSLGVSIVVSAISQCPELFHGAVFVCGAVSNPFDHMFHTDKLNAIFQIYSKLCELAPDTMTEVWRRFTARTPFNFFMASRFGFNPFRAQDRDVNMYLEGVNRTPMSVFHTLLRDYVDFDGRSLLGKIAMSVLVVAGESDYITPLKVQEEMVKLLPNSQLELVPYGSHNAHMDYADRVNRRIETFLKEIGYV